MSENLNSDYNDYNENNDNIENIENIDIIDINENNDIITNIANIEDENKNEDNTKEEIKENTPAIIYTIDNSQNPPERFYSSNYYNNTTNSVNPEDSYNKLTVREDNKSNADSYVYRWSSKDESLNANNKHNKKQKKIKKSAGLKIFAAAMSIMFLFSAGVSSMLLLNRFNAQKDKQFAGENNSPAAVISSMIEDTSIVLPKDTNGETLDISAVIAKMKPSVVCIQVEVTLTYGGKYYYQDRDYSQEGVGTGFILTADGYIATNYHVVDGAKNIMVTLNSGDSYKATLIGGDEVADLAVIKIDAKNLPVAQLGNSDNSVEGEFVVAIGNPGGIEFIGSSTLGIISAVNRTVDITETRQMSVIQTDASINPGNSGGPLVNMKGQVIGINTLKLSSSLYEGMGFAIPINSAIPTLNEIIANPGTINRESGSARDTLIDTSSVSFGINGSTVTPEESAAKNIPQGFKISSIVPGGACDGSGLQNSDIITALDGEIVTSFDDLTVLKNRYDPGDTVIVTVYRNGDEIDFEITLQAKQ